MKNTFEKPWLEIFDLNASDIITDSKQMDNIDAGGIGDGVDTDY